MKGFTSRDWVDPLKDVLTLSYDEMSADYRKLQLDDLRRRAIETWASDERDGALVDDKETD